jgi:hypothetical protein
LLLLKLGLENGGRSRICRRTWARRSGFGGPMCGMTRSVGGPCFFAGRGSWAREIGRLSGEASGGFN